MKCLALLAAYLSSDVGTMLADRGSPSRTAISPNISPGPISLTQTSRPLEEYRSPSARPSSKKKTSVEREPFSTKVRPLGARMTRKRRVISVRIGSGTCFRSWNCVLCEDPSLIRASLKVKRNGHTRALVARTIGYTNCDGLVDLWRNSQLRGGIPHRRDPSQSIGSEM